VKGAVAAFFVLAIAAHALHALTGFGGTGSDAFFSQRVYDGVMVAAGLVAVARAVIVRQDRLAWTILALGLSSYAAGGLYWSLVHADDVTPPSPTGADALWILYYPCVYVGIALLMRSQVVAHRAAVWLDGLTGALAIGALGTAIVLPRVLSAYQGDTAALILNVAYPIGDMLVLGFVVAAMTVGWSTVGRAWYLLAAGLVVNSLANSAYVYSVATETYTRGTLQDSGWLLAAGLIALAAWQRPQVSAGQARSDRAIFAPLAASLAALGLSVYGILYHLTPVAAVLTVATLFAVVLRLALTLTENRTMLSHSQVEATTDALSGLGNRRRLMPDLEEAVQSPAATLVLFDLDGFKNYNDSFGHPAGDALLQRLSRRLDQAAQDHQGTAYRMGGDEFCVLLPCSGAAAEPGIGAALVALSEQGEGFIVTSSHGAVSLPDEATQAAPAMQLADQRLYSRKGGRRSSPRGQTKAALLQLIDETNPELGEHAFGVAALAVATARHLGMDAEEIDEVGRAAELHDIGKIAIPNEILRKPGPLTLDEWLLMHEHTMIGERILSAAAALAPVGRIVRATHERWDGEGYPDRLAGEEIPLGARVIAVCDAFDAMTSGRPYRSPVAFEAALHELRRCAGSQFDPRVMNAFLEIVHSLCEPWRDEPMAGASSGS
jgi:diguanylate cyclase (GGDEF)-like protein